MILALIYAHVTHHHTAEGRLEARWEEREFEFVGWRRGNWVLLRWLPLRKPSPAPVQSSPDNNSTKYECPFPPTSVRECLFWFGCFCCCLPSFVIIFDVFTLISHSPSSSLRSIHFINYITTKLCTHWLSTIQFAFLWFLHNFFDSLPRIPPPPIQPPPLFCVASSSFASLPQTQVWIPSTCTCVRWNFDLWRLVLVQYVQHDLCKFPKERIDFNTLKQINKDPNSPING